MLGILLFFRRIIRFILKFFLIVSVGGAFLDIGYWGINKYTYISIITAVVCAAGLIYYDKLIFHIARINGTEVELPR